MMDTLGRRLSDGEEMDEMVVEEHGSRLLYDDPRNRVIEARRQASEPPQQSEVRQ